VTKQRYFSNFEKCLSIFKYYIWCSDDDDWLLYKYYDYYYYHYYWTLKNWRWV